MTDIILKNKKWYDTHEKKKTETCVEILICTYIRDWDIHLKLRAWNFFSPFFVRYLLYSSRSRSGVDTLFFQFLYFIVFFFHFQLYIGSFNIRLVFYFVLLLLYFCSVSHHTVETSFKHVTFVFVWFDKNFALT